MCEPAKHLHWYPATNPNFFGLFLEIINRFIVFSPNLAFAGLDIASKQG